MILPYPACKLVVTCSRVFQPPTSGSTSKYTIVQAWITTILSTTRDLTTGSLLMSRLSWLCIHCSTTLASRGQCILTRPIREWEPSPENSHAATQPTQPTQPIQKTQMIQTSLEVHQAWIYWEE